MRLSRLVRLRRLLPVLLLLLGAARAQTLRFAVIGDSGSGGAGQLGVARQMEKAHQKHHWQFVLMLGDNIYEDGDPRYFDRKFKGVYANLMKAGVRFHAVLGNHDRRHPASRNGMAQVEDDAFGFIGRQDEYVLEAGPEVEGKTLARFIALNSDAWLAELGDQERIETRLRRLRGWLAESKRFHWNFAFFHHPLYSFGAPKSPWGVLIGRHSHGPEEELRRILEPEFKGRINAVFSGHEHFYQKIRPQHGIHYFISGGGSKIRRGVSMSHPQVEFGAAVLHFLDMELSVEELRYAAISDQDVEIHAGRIRKPLENGASRRPG